MSREKELLQEVHREGDISVGSVAQTGLTGAALEKGDMLGEGASITLVQVGP